MDYDSKTFCINPWSTAHSFLNEGYNPCCLWNDAVDQNINDYVNGQKLAQIKLDLLSGVQINECKTCWQQEQSGITSKRQRDNQTYKKLIPTIMSNSMNGKFIEYYVRLGNNCNLRCVTCNDTCSTGWISELKKYNLPHGPVQEVSDKHEIWNYIRANRKYAGVIEFVGGEPLMLNLDLQQSLLEDLCKTNDNKHIVLKYNTNGTKTPENLMKLWPNFKRVELNVSIDGVTDQFEYIRFPAKWDELLKTINCFKELRDKNDQIAITAMTTVNILNVGYLKEIIDFCKDVDIRLHLNMLHRPMHLNIFNFNSKVNSWIIDQLPLNHSDTVDAIKQKLNQTNNDQTDNLINFCNTLDSRRNTNAASVFPDLWNRLK